MTFSKKVRVPLFPLIPLVPMALFVGSFVTAIRALMRVRRLERRLAT
ncbi:MAG TPA: hypothetical protein VI456_06415 [Polyangia bacterium]